MQRSKQNMESLSGWDRILFHEHFYANFKADFHSVQNVARSTFSERLLLNYKQSSGTNLISCG